MRRPRGFSLPLLRAAALCVLAGSVACTEEPEPVCTGEGDPDLTATPSLFDYDPLTDGARVPVYVPLQGGVFTELDLEVTGASSDDISAFTFVVRLAGGDVAANPAPSMSFPFECRSDGSLLIEQMPVAFDPSVWSSDNIAELDERPATIVIQMQLKGGMAPVTREYDVVLDYRTFN